MARPPPPPPRRPPGPSPSVSIVNTAAVPHHAPSPLSAPAGSVLITSIPHRFYDRLLKHAKESNIIEDVASVSAFRLLRRLSPLASLIACGHVRGCISTVQEGKHKPGVPLVPELRIRSEYGFGMTRNIVLDQALDIVHCENNFQALMQPTSIAFAALPNQVKQFMQDANADAKEFYWVGLPLMVKDRVYGLLSIDIFQEGYIPMPEDIVRWGVEVTRGLREEIAELQALDRRVSPPLPPHAHNSHEPAFAAAVQPIGQSELPTRPPRPHQIQSTAWFTGPETILPGQSGRTSRQGCYSVDASTDTDSKADD